MWQNRGGLRDLIIQTKCQKHRKLSFYNYQQNWNILFKIIPTLTLQLTSSVYSPFTRNYCWNIIYTHFIYIFKNSKYFFIRGPLWIMDAAASLIYFHLKRIPYKSQFGLTAEWNSITLITAWEEAFSLADTSANIILQFITIIMRVFVLKIDFGNTCYFIMEISISC